MDDSMRMLQEASGKRLPAAELGNDRQNAYSKVSNGVKIESTDLPTVPKRKLSVFYRSFDVIASMSQEKEKETLEFRRTSSTPSVRTEKTQETMELVNDGNHQATSSCTKSFSSHPSMAENRKLLRNTSFDRVREKFSSNNEQASKAVSLSPASFKLSQVREDASIDNYATITETSIGKHFKLNNGGQKFKNQGKEEKNIPPNFREQYESSQPGNFYSLTNARNVTNYKADGFARTDIGTSIPRQTLDPASASSNGRLDVDNLVKIKDTEYARASASDSDRFGKYTAVGGGMSNHEDSPIGSDSEDDRRNTNSARRSDDIVNRGRSQAKGSVTLRRPPEEVTKEASEKSGFRVEGRTKDAELHVRQEKRQSFTAARRSLSEGDNDSRRRAKCHCKCTKEKEATDEKIQAFPSFADGRLEASGLSNSREMNVFYRENMPENELERKYIAFSIGLSTDRITLQRRMTLSLRHRDLAERNLKSEIEKMEEEIQELLPLCMDGESIEKIERVQQQLDTIARCARKVSSAAETLGAVHKEFTFSKAICIADKYLQTLRAKCENLATDISETKQILLKNNIVIEEGPEEIGDDLFKIRYRNGIPTNNRTVVARRRASIATISRPLISQDSIKEVPKQRNSVSGRMTLRRPSLCSDEMRLEKLNRTSSSNSVCELCDLIEQIESTSRNSIKEGNSPSTKKEDEVDTEKCDTSTNVENTERLNDKRRSFLESSAARNPDKQLKFCKITAEDFRITKLIVTWPTIFWCTLIFFLGFFTKHVTSVTTTLDRSL